MSFASSTFSQAPFASQGTVSPTVILTGISCRSVARVASVTVISGSLVILASADTGTVEPQVREIISVADTASSKGSLGTASAKNDSLIVSTATLTKVNISTNTTAVGVIFDFESVRDTFSQKRTVYVERQTTSLDRTVNVSAFPRVAYAQRQTTTGDRTIFVPFEDRRVYVERQTTSAERTVRVAA